MELAKDILASVLGKEEIAVTFPNLKIDATEIVKMECYKALQQIKSIIENEKLSDYDCFMKIEAIVGVFESMGSDGGGRHDFG